MNNQNMIETVTRISGVNPRKCMRCGKCSASCPAYDEMEYHPHQFVSMVENGRIEELLITACPLCSYNLLHNTDGALPVVYFTELLAEALGCGEEDA